MLGSARAVNINTPFLLFSIVYFRIDDTYKLYYSYVHKYVLYLLDVTSTLRKTINSSPKHRIILTNDKEIQVVKYVSDLIF